VLGMSDRILVMREGSIVAELDGPTATQEGIMTLAAAAEEHVA
jgi:ribose transport system ATP-binding protein